MKQNNRKLPRDTKRFEDKNQESQKIYQYNSSRLILKEEKNRAQKK
jgi:hypothetical protein